MVYEGYEARQPCDRFHRKLSAPKGEHHFWQGRGEGGDEEGEEEDGEDQEELE